MMKKMISTLALVSLAAAITTPAHAELVATPLRGDTRLVEFMYEEDNTYLLLTKPLYVTHVRFNNDETIQSVAAGDTAQWEIVRTSNLKNLFIKPRYEGLETSVTVITSKRVYQFILKSTGAGKKWHQRVSWQYGSDMLYDQDTAIQNEEMRPARMPSGPRGEANAVAIGPAGAALDAPSTGLSPGSMNFDYEIAGDGDFKPSVVFEDGKFTYIKIPRHSQELPVLFSVVDGNDYALVNYTVNGDYMVAQRVLDSAVLKLGKSEVRIAKKKKRSWFGSTN